MDQHQLGSGASVAGAERSGAQLALQAGARGVRDRAVLCSERNNHTHITRARVACKSRLA